MAKVKNPCMSEDARGKLGDLVFEKNKKTNYVKFNKVSKKPPSDKQKSNNKKWGEGIETWRNLSPENKQTWNDFAKEKKGSGFNYFMKDWMLMFDVGIYGVNEYNFCVY